jgi:hypothetical protein
MAMVSGDGGRRRKRVGPKEEQKMSKRHQTETVRRRGVSGFWA